MQITEVLPSDYIDLDQLTITALNDTETKEAKNYLELTKNYQEIHNLFRVYYYNMESLRSTFLFTNGDKVRRLKQTLFNFTDFEQINAMFISFISSGKTLVNALETCLDANVSCTISKDFHKFISSKYDESFSYRFIERLRDFSQHGYLPVRIDDDTVCFDIFQISSVSHFHHNPKIKQEMDNFVDEVLHKKHSLPHYMFTVAVAEYSAVMAEIYLKFWNTLEPYFIKTVKGFFGKIITHPEYVLHKNHEYDGCIVCFFDHFYHIIPMNEHPEKEFKKYKYESIELKEHEEREKVELLASMRFFK